VIVAAVSPRVLIVVEVLLKIDDVKRRVFVNSSVPAVVPPSARSISSAFDFSSSELPLDVIKGRGGGRDGRKQYSGVVLTYDLLSITFQIFEIIVCRVLVAVQIRFLLQCVPYMFSTVVFVLLG